MRCRGRALAGVLSGTGRTDAPRSSAGGRVRMTAAALAGGDPCSPAARIHPPPHPPQQARLRLPELCLSALAFKAASIGCTALKAGGCWRRRRRMWVLAALAHLVWLAVRLRASSVAACVQEWAAASHTQHPPPCALQGP